MSAARLGPSPLPDAGHQKRGEEDLHDIADDERREAELEDRLVPAEYRSKPQETRDIDEQKPQKCYGHGFRPALGPAPLGETTDCRNGEQIAQLL
jgi:hypothetical protein